MVNVGLGIQLGLRLGLGLVLGSLRYTSSLWINSILFLLHFRGCLPEPRKSYGHTIIDRRKVNQNKRKSNATPKTRLFFIVKWGRFSARGIFGRGWPLFWTLVFAKLHLCHCLCNVVQFMSDFVVFTNCIFLFPFTLLRLESANMVSLSLVCLAMLLMCLKWYNECEDSEMHFWNPFHRKGKSDPRWWMKTLEI